MNPLLKKALAALAAKEVIEKIVEARRPKRPSRAARFGRLLLIAGGLGAGYYAYKNGKLQPLIDKVKGAPSGYGSGAPTAASGNGAGEGGDITFRSEDQPVGTPVGT